MSEFIPVRDFSEVCKRSGEEGMIPFNDIFCKTVFGVGCCMEYAFSDVSRHVVMELLMRDRVFVTYSDDARKWRFNFEYCSSERIIPPAESIRWVKCDADEIKFLGVASGRRCEEYIRRRVGLGITVTSTSCVGCVIFKREEISAEILVGLLALGASVEYSNELESWTVAWDTLRVYGNIKSWANAEVVCC